MRLIQGMSEWGEDLLVLNSELMVMKRRRRRVPEDDLFFLPFLSDYLDIIHGLPSLGPGIIFRLNRITYMERLVGTAQTSAPPPG